MKSDQLNQKQSGQNKSSKLPEATSSKIEEAFDSTAKQMAGQQIIGGLINVGWRLAVAVLIPIMIGIQIDKGSGKDSTNTFGGFVLAICLALYIIYKEYQQIQRDQSSQETARRNKSQEK